MSIFHKTKPKGKNKAITAILVGTGVVMFWRGLWGLMDAHLLPQNPTVSNVLSLIGGLAILYVTHYLVRELM